MKNHGYMCIEFLDHGQGLADSIHDALYFDITIHKWVDHGLYFSNGQPYHVIPASSMS